MATVIVAAAKKKREKTSDRIAETKLSSLKKNCHAKAIAITMQNRKRTPYPRYLIIIVYSLCLLSQ